MAEGEVVIRRAVPGDGRELVPLMALLGHVNDEAGVCERITRLTATGEAPLVASIGNAIVGLCGLHFMHTIHRERPVGRITILVLSEAARGRGLGRALVDRAEAVLNDAGCSMIEVTSNERLAEAHAFYDHIGFALTGKRFARPIER